MNTKELNNLDMPALEQQIKTWRIEYFTVREDVRHGKEKNHAHLKQVRRDIARALTVLKNKQAAALHS